jgi:hypothetical protein
MTSLLLPACAGIYSTGYSDKPLMTEIVLRNKTANALQDVGLRVQRFNQVFSCSYILANSECSNRFRARPYNQNEIVIQWNSASRSLSSGPIAVAPPEFAHAGEPLRAVIEFLGPVEFKAFFELIQNEADS